MKKSLFIFATLFFISNSILAQVPGNVPTLDLEAWWSFSGNANDLSGNGNNMTNSGATLTQDRNGVSNSAYNFSGSSQYLSVPTPNFSFGATDSFTVSYWQLKPSNSYGLAIMKSSSANGNFIWLFQTGNTGSYQFGTNKQGSSWSWAQTTHATNQWEHFVGTYQNGSMTLYKNGVQVATSSYTHTGANKVNLTLWIGRGHNPNYFTGKIDDIGIWSRVLTQTEITSLYVGCNASVSGQPVDATTTIGNNAMFGLSTATQGLTYQWESDSSGSFQSLSNNATYAGTTTDTLNITGVTQGLDGVKYRCVVADGTSCFDTSLTATLNVCGAITTQPVDQTLTIGAKGAIGLASNDPNATYKWQLKSGTSYIDLINNTYYSGTKTDTLIINSATVNLNGVEYRCIMTSNVCSDTSDLVKLTVSGYAGLIDLDNNQGMVFPNPAKDKLTLKVREAFLNKEFMILNPLGEIVYEGDIMAIETKINISGYQQGNYILIINKESYSIFSVID